MLGSDESLVSTLKSGSAEQRERLVAELRAFLRASLTRSFGRQLSSSDLEDVTQDSVVRIHSRLDDFRQQCLFTTWATTIAVNCALSELRRRRYQHVSIDDAAAQASAALIHEAESASAHSEQQLLRLREGIERALTERQRTATLAKLGGLPLMEIARRLDTSQGAVYKLLHDARRRLKIYLETAERSNDDRRGTPAGAS